MSSETLQNIHKRTGNAFDLLEDLEDINDSKNMNSQQIPQFPTPTYEPYEISENHVCVWNPWEGVWYEVIKYDGYENDFDPMYWRQ